jgi:hypothetical protein
VADEGRRGASGDGPRPRIPVRDRVFGHIIKCLAQENGKRQKYDKT